MSEPAKKTNPHLLAIDQGTTSSRAILFSAAGDVELVAQRELKLYYPNDGWVEQQADAIWADTQAVCREVIQAAEKQGMPIAALGITNQRETTVVWDKKTGQPVYNAIVWQDRRTANYCAELRAAGHEATLTEKTGLLLDPYFCATKIRWILNEVEGARARAEAGELLFGTIDCFLLWHLTGGKRHATDITNASRTAIFDIHEQCWDKQLLKLFDIPESLLPEVVDNTGDFGHSTNEALGAELPIAAMIGDQQSALVGQGCFAPGSIKSTYGTGCFMLMNTGTQALPSKHRLLTTVAYRLGGETHYALEGSIFVAGAAIQWLRDGLELFDDAAASEALAQTVENNGGVYFVPALTGLGAPYWRADARGMIVGITRDTNRGHIARAALEAQAYQTRDLVSAMQADGGSTPPVLRVDGGLVANALACQQLADTLQTSVEVPKIVEATAWGAASLAGLQAGVFYSVDDIAKVWQLDKGYRPASSAADADAQYAGWQQAINRLLD
ncbi:MAG: glycerol kinase GlpK [Pseudomonadales bacterium]|nr:glycerol kinase GlpK [Pseudomonadales bacterium]